MRFWTVILIALLLAMPARWVLSQEEGEDQTTDETVEEGFFDEELPADEEIPKEELAPVSKIRRELEAPPVEEAEKPEEGPKKLSIDAVVIVKYTFNGSKDFYNIKYHLNMGGQVRGATDQIKGNAKIATDISGYLANYPGACQCLLKVSISDIPYEITFKREDETEAEIEVSFKGQILEDWESLCTFLDATHAKFNTKGAPERWIGVALEKARPSLTRMTVPIDSKKTTNMKFSIPKHTVEDEKLGSAEVEGTGVVTIESIRTKSPRVTPEKD